MSQSKKAIKQLSAGQNARTVLTVPVDMVVADPEQPRKTFDNEFIEGLTQSIETQGQIHPATVYDNGEQYVLISGENRWRASHKTQAKTLDILVVDKPATPEDLLAKQIVENEQSNSLTPVDKAYSYKRLLESGNQNFNTLKKIGEQVGKSEAYISRIVKLVDLSDEAKDLVRQEISSVDAAIDLNDISKDDPELATQMAVEAKKKGKLERAQTRKIKSLLDKKPNKAPKEVPPKHDYGVLESKINRALDALNGGDLSLTLTLLKESMAECLKVKDKQQ